MRVRVWRSKHTLKILKSTINLGVKTHSYNCVLHIRATHFTGVKEGTKILVSKSEMYGRQNLCMERPKCFDFFFTCKETRYEKRQESVPLCCEKRGVLFWLGHQKPCPAFFLFPHFLSIIKCMFSVLVISRPSLTQLSFVLWQRQCIWVSLVIF